MLEGLFQQTKEYIWDPPLRYHGSLWPRPHQMEEAWGAAEEDGKWLRSKAISAA